jgi:hypothetical protein
LLKVFIYYTGHASDNSEIIMPSGETVSYIDVRNSVLSYLDPRAQIVWIADCCKAGNFGFAFTLHEKKFILAQKTFTDRDVICITSSREDQESIANKKYSYFSKYLFREFSSKNIRLSKIVRLVEEKLLIRTHQKVGVHSSYNRVPVIWPWFYGDTDNEIAINANFITMK